MLYAVLGEGSSSRTVLNMQEGVVRGRLRSFIVRSKGLIIVVVVGERGEWTCRTWCLN